MANQITCKMDYLAAVATLRCAEIDLALADDPSNWDSEAERLAWLVDGEIELAKARLRVSEASANLKRYEPAIRDYVETALGYTKAWQLSHVEDNVKILEAWLEVV